MFRDCRLCRVLSRPTLLRTNFKRSRQTAMVVDEMCGHTTTFIYIRHEKKLLVMERRLRSTAYIELIRISSGLILGKRARMVPRLGCHHCHHHHRRHRRRRRPCHPPRRRRPDLRYHFLRASTAKRRIRTEVKERRERLLPRDFGHLLRKRKHRSDRRRRHRRRPQTGLSPSC